MAQWILFPAVAAEIRVKPSGMLLAMDLLAHCVHCPCCSTVMTLRGATATTETASFLKATKQIEHRDSMEHVSEQRKNRIHGLLIWSRCVRCFVPCHVRSLSLYPFQRLCRPAVRCAVVFDVMLLEFRLRQVPCGARIQIPCEAQILLSQAAAQFPCVAVLSLTIPVYHAETLITIGMKGNNNLMKSHWSLAGFDRGPYGYCPYTLAS